MGNKQMEACMAGWTNGCFFFSSSLHIIQGNILDALSWEEIYRLKVYQLKKCWIVL